MKEQIDFYRFCNGFTEMNRNENFSYDGKRALFDWLEQYEEDTGEEIEFDAIMLCCDFTEYESLKEFNKEHAPAKNIEEIEERTIVIPINKGGFIVQCY